MTRPIAPRGTTRLGFEPLEDRTTPAGLVTASLSLSGVLNITGSPQANSIGISEDGTDTVVTGFATAVNGVGAARFPTSSIRLITADLGGGSDQYTVAGLTLRQGLTINDAAGNNFIELADVSAPTGSINITLGGGADGLYLGVFGAVSAGAIAVDLGGGDDFMFSGFVGGSVSAGQLSVDGGAGDDDIELDSVTAGRLTMTGGAGDDTLALTVATVDRLTINGGAGADFVITGGVAATSGTVNGGAGAEDIFLDLGGNSGFAAINFEGFL